MAESKLRTLSVDFAVQILDLENLPSKFLPCKLTLWGEEVKTLANFYLHPMVRYVFVNGILRHKNQNPSEIEILSKKVSL